MANFYPNHEAYINLTISSCSYKNGYFRCKNCKVERRHKRLLIEQMSSTCTVNVVLVNMEHNRKNTSQV